MWKWKHMLKKMVIPGDRIVEEESEDIDTDRVEPYPDSASIGDIDESTPDMLSSYSDTGSPGTSIQSPDSGIQSSPFHTRSYGKAKSGKAKRVAQLRHGHGLVYLPVDINGLTKKIHLLAA